MPARRLFAKGGRREVDVGPQKGVDCGPTLVGEENKISFRRV